MSALSSKRRGVLRRLRSKLRQPRKVTCTACGFLTIEGRELKEADRYLLELRTSNMPSDLEKLACHRGLWIDLDVHYSGGGEAQKLEEATQLRACRWYFKYRHGWSPEEHRELLLQREDRIRDSVINAMFMFLGAALAVLVQLVSSFLDEQ